MSATRIGRMELRIQALEKLVDELRQERGEVDKGDGGKATRPSSSAADRVGPTPAAALPIDESAHDQGGKGKGAPPKNKPFGT